MAEQFNRQQLIIARSIAKNIESDIGRLEEETLSFAKLMFDRDVDRGNIGEFVNNAFIVGRDETNIDIKILDNDGSLLYSFFSDSLKPDDHHLFELAKKVAPGKVRFIDKVDKEQKIILLAQMADSTRTQGVLIVEMMIDSINQKFLVPIRAGIRGHAWMMNSRGTLLYHPTQPTMVGKNLYQTDRSCFECHKTFEVEKRILESGDIGFSSYMAPYGEDKLIAFSRAAIKDMSWIVCVSIPYSEVTFSIRKSLRLHSLLVISIFLATVTGAFALVVLNRKRVKAEEKAIHLERQSHLEKEIVQAKDYLENVLQSTESKIMVLDRELIIRTVNSAHERLCGLKKENVVGKDFFDIFPIKDEKEKDRINDILGMCLEGSNYKLDNYPYVREYETLYLNISINPLILHGDISGIILSSSEVTQEVNLREELRNYAARLEDIVKERTDELLSEKEKLNAIVETLEAGIFIVDSSRNINWVNRTLKEWMGAEDISDISLDRIYGGTEIQRSIVNNKIVQEIIFQDLGKRKGFFQLTSTPLVGPDGKFQALVLMQDITEMKKIEEQMMHSEKLSALARISAGVAHEIGNPLTSISSYVQILREMDFDDFTKESLDTIERHLKRITDIVRQMSSFSRTATSDVKRHNIREVVDSTLELVRYDKRMEDMQITIDISADLPDIMVDETQMIQVFMNIILNAADAMSAGGTLDIMAERLEKDIEISFADSGTGIQSEYIEKIFDPFFTTKDKGTGLGLGVSYSIIKSYQGDISVENRSEGGALFKVRLPYHES
jgi:PAS domain S-box-containing protein